MPRCFPHIINIATQTVNKELKENPHMVVVSAATPADSPDRRNELQRYETALVSDPVGKARSIVAALRVSGQRRADLREIIFQGNLEKCWDVPVPLAQPLRDCDTRWASLRAMINRVIELYPVSFHSWVGLIILISHRFLRQFCVFLTSQSMQVSPHINSQPTSIKFSMIF